MEDQKGKELARKFYDQEAKKYIDLYTREGEQKYPANFIRLEFIVKRLKEVNAKSVLDCGCGSAGPIVRLIREGFESKGFDFSPQMVVEGRKELVKHNLDPKLIFEGDLEKKEALPHEKFDALLALGVFPHIVHEKTALTNMKTILNKGGRVFIEFRNELFAAFTLNKYSVDFFLNKIIPMHLLPEEVKSDVIDYYTKRFEVEKPHLRADGKISYSEILAKFHNPLAIAEELFKPLGFTDVKLHFYHFHALPPIFEKKYPALFREASMKIENTSDWRGHLLCSAYVVEAVLK